MPQGQRRYLIDTDEDGMWQVRCQDCERVLGTVPDHEVGELATLAIEHRCSA